MPNAIRCINHRFVFKNFGIACLALIFSLSYLRSTILLQFLHPKKRRNKSSDMTIHIHFFFGQLIWTNGWVVKARVASLVTRVKFPHGAESFCRSAAILRGTESVSALTLRFLYCCALFFFFFLDFVSGDCWQGLNFEYEHLTSTVLEHLTPGPGPGHMFGSGTWVWL